MNGYWETVEKMWGKTAAEAVHWVFDALFFSALLIGIILVVFHIVSVAMIQMKEHDKSLGEALKVGMQGMVKFVILIVCAAIAIPLIWELLVPFLITQGYDPDKKTLTILSLWGQY